MVKRKTQVFIIVFCWSVIVSASGTVPSPCPCEAEDVMTPLLTFSVTSSPSGATVRIGTSILGKTPFTFKQAYPITGETRIRGKTIIEGHGEMPGLMFEKKGYEPYFLHKKIMMVNTPNGRQWPKICPIHVILKPQSDRQPGY